MVCGTIGSALTSGDWCQSGLSHKLKIRGGMGSGIGLVCVGCMLNLLSINVILLALFYIQKCVTSGVLVFFCFLTNAFIKRNIVLFFFAEPFA